MSPRQAFKQHMAGAAQRGVVFDLSFREWWALWEPYWHLRGRGRDDMQMCRTRDEGGYTVGNVRIDTQRANAAEHGVVRRVRKASVAFKNPLRLSSAETGLDWCRRRDVFTPYVEEDEGVDA